ncbi:MAG: hypothetical protein Kilf2KO_49180 [Rhodospirillales bacterium]
MSERQDVYDRSIEGWHLDKRVPVALLMTLFLAVLSGVYAYSRLESKVADHDLRLDRLEAQALASGRATQTFLSRVERLDATLVAELAAIKLSLENLRKDLRERSRP